MTAHLSTAKTLLGFIKAVVRRRFPGLTKADDLSHVYNYVLINGELATSGQPNEEELLAIGRAGYQKVINLAPTSVLENSVIDERGILASANVDYVHIPVDFKAPSEADFRKFVNELESTEPSRLWVHCAANMRVSAFIYRYRRDFLNQSAAEARSDLQRIWEPMGVWKEFVRNDDQLSSAPDR